MFRKVLLALIAIIVLLGPAACRPTLCAGHSSTLTPSASPTTVTLGETESTLTFVPYSQPTPTLDQVDYERQLIEQVDRDRALADLRKLTGEDPICGDAGCHTIANRLTGSEGLQWAKQYIQVELVRLGYSAEVNDWSDSGHADQNIIARKDGASVPAEEVYFVAHLDGVQKGSDERFPAADDNAGGVVDLLELARILDGHSLNRTVVLFFSTGEEQGTFGVTSYLNHISRSELRSIKAVVDIDMIGYDANGDGVMELWHGDHPPSRLLAEEFSSTIQAFQFKLSPKLVVGCG